MLAALLSSTEVSGRTYLSVIICSFLPSHHDNYSILTAAVWGYCHSMQILDPVNISADVVAFRA